MSRKKKESKPVDQIQLQKFSPVLHSFFHSTNIGHLLVLGAGDTSVNKIVQDALLNLIQSCIILVQEIKHKETEQVNYMVWL